MAFCLRAREIVAGRNESRTPTPDQGEVWYVLARAPVVTGRDLRSATENRSSQNPGQWQINFSLSADAARRFGPFTEQNINRQMAIVLQHRVYSAPVIHGRIDDTGVIEGNFSQDSAHDLALVLRPARCLRPLNISKSAPSGRHWEPIRFATVSRLLF